MYNANKEEQEILKFWQDDKTFEKSVSDRPDDKPYVFYDGPPFATGLPHYGHILSSVIKDVVPRYQTMKGYRVRRRWGWDCHGMPIENLVEKELKISGKKDIEEKLGVDKFNATCRSKVLTYTHEWKKMVERIGRWVEFDNAYKTMDQTYMESVWWALKNIWDKGLIYEGRKVLMYCPRCETPVSKAEVAMDDSYKDVTEETVTVKFKVKRLKDYKIDIPENTYILAWTTTPWTLPGNVALAVGENIQYTIFNIQDEPGVYIAAKERVEAILENKRFTIIDEVPGSSLIGLEYEPLFDIPAIHETGKKAWYVTSADFVTTEEGTGVVHTAVVYGEDDYNLGLKIGLPVVPLLDEKGHFNEMSPELVRGQYFKKAEKAIKEDLEARGLMFKKENFTHSYPHCWRCDTQLFYNAISAWFIDIQKIKDRLVKLNQKINWVPEHLKDGRFLNILETAPDWNISRNRYWATPLPFWRCRGVGCANTKCIGSIDELRKHGDRKITKIIFVRHGESEINSMDRCSNLLDKYSLTKDGEKQVKELAKNLNEQVDLIISSPILRARQTAELLQKKLQVDLEFSDLLMEEDVGEWNDVERAVLQEDADFRHYRTLRGEDKFNFKRGRTGESDREIAERMRKLLQEVLQKHQGQTVIFVSHGCMNANLLKILRNIGPEQYYKEKNITHATPIPFYLDENGEELDLHKHNIDKVKLHCEECGGEMERIPEVIDCWVESASMPFAEFHYPFENEAIFKARFPGQYIAEYIAQTRAWFYYMHVMATLLFDDVSFENVVCTGTILNEKGEKLSKSKMNYTDPWKIIEQYGVDALRYYLMTSVVMQAENLYFNDREVKDVYNKVVNILWNVVEFYSMYNTESTELKDHTESKNVLDKWIMAKLNLLVKEVTENMDKYDTVRAGRPIKDFVDDLSTWYLRRSRDRFKGDNIEDKDYALSTLRFVLSILAKLMAPFMPFLAERVWREINKTRKQENSEIVSVHLETWPEVNEKMIDEGLLKEMSGVREAVTLTLSARDFGKVRVRQPLHKVYLSVHDFNFQSEQLINIFKDEVNVKEVEEMTPQNDIGDKQLGIIEMDGERWVQYRNENGSEFVLLKIEITPELKKEGLLREVVRTINQIRKEQKLTISDRVAVEYETSDEELLAVFTDFSVEIKNSVLATELKKTSGGEEVEIDGKKINLTVK